MTHNNSGPISHPQAHPSNQLLMLSILLISLVLGGGIVWVYCDYRYEKAVSRSDKQTLKLEVCESKLDLNRNIETTLLDIISLTGKYQKKSNVHLIDKSPDVSNTLIPLQEELENLKRLYIGYEEKLAKIENRGQRQIDLNFYKIIAK